MNPIIEIIAEQLKRQSEFRRLWKPRAVNARVVEARRDPSLGLGWLKVTFTHPDTGDLVEANDVPFLHPPGLLPALPEWGDEVLLVYMDNVEDPVYASAIRTATSPHDREAPGEFIARGLFG